MLGTLFGGINFIGTLVALVLYMYLFNRVIYLEDRVNNNVLYQIMNDRQLRNLVNDINYNDTALGKSIIRSTH